MELRHLRYFVAVGEGQHFRNAAERLHVSQSALSRQIQGLEEELGFKLFERLQRGVKLSAAGKLFLQDTRRILRQIEEAANRSRRVASGRSGTLRLGFVETLFWHGVVPKSFRRFHQQHPDAELELHALRTVEQIEAIRSGRLDAGFLFNDSQLEKELVQLRVAVHESLLAVPTGHPLTKIKRLRLRDLRDTSFVWFPRLANPEYYDRLIHTCARRGLTNLRIVQETTSHATMLSLVLCRAAVAFVSGSVRWLCPSGVSLLRITDLHFPANVALVWRDDNHSSLLRDFVADVRRLPEVKALGHVKSKIAGGTLSGRSSAAGDPQSYRQEQRGVSRLRDEL